MTNLELLNILTNVRGEYILQAQELRSGQRKQLRLMHRKRIFLIAAVISLLLLLVGCAAVLVGLQRAHLGHMVFFDTFGESFERDVLSLNGYVDSPEYRATLEWMEFENSYDQDKTLLRQADAERYMVPPDYYAYLCYTEEMLEKIDEICQKYDLALAGPIYFSDQPEQTLEAVEVSSIGNGNSNEELSLNDGRYYRSGSFLVGGTLQHRFADRSDMDTVLFTYSCNKKKMFIPRHITTDDLDSFDVWEYTAWDGTQLLLAQNKERGLILTDTGDYFTSVVLYFSLGEVVEVGNPEQRTDMEQIADAFAYAIQPREPETQWLQNPNGLSNGEAAPEKQTYADYFANWMPGSVGSDAYSPDYQQKFVDLDEDGADEMLIWNAHTGVVYEVVIMVDGGPQCVYGGGTYGDDDHTVELYLCEGNILERDCGGSVQGKQLNEYYRMEDKQLLSVECVMEGIDGKFYWSESGGASSMMWKEITEAEYNTVRGNYVRIGVPQYPAPERIEEIQKSEENILLQVLENQESFFSMSSGMSCTLSEYCSSEGDRMGLDVAITRYAFVDMDADGVQEAVVDFRFGENSQVMCIVLKYDSDNALVQGTEFYYRQMYLLKEDGSFAYSGGADNDGWAKLRWDRLNSQWETIPVEDGSDKPDVQWYSYPITSDET